ncbi:MAG: sulfotransferase, partial [Gammaproteobacteria bacterium]
MRTDGANWEGPLFVIGMPRSGTKLLRNLLDRHPRIRILPWETDFLPFIDAWVASRGEPRTEAELARLASALRKSPYFDYRQKARGPLSVELWH